MSKKQQGKISTLDFFCIGFGAIVGIGWAVYINRWMANSGGPLPAATGYLMCLVLLVPVALCYCELVPMMPVAGGGAAFAYAAFGQNVSFISGWAAFGGFVLICPWEAIMMSNIISYAFPGLMAGEPLYVLAGEPIFISHFVIGIGMACVLFFLNWRGIGMAAGAQKLFTLTFMAIGIAAMLFALGKFDPANLEPIYENVRNRSHSNFFGGVIAIMVSAPFFLAGFETVPQAVEDASGKVSSVGKMVVASVAAACLFYAIALVSFGGAMPWVNFWNELPFPAAGNLFLNIYQGGLSSALYAMVIIVALLGLLTTWNGFMLASPRLLMGMARANMIPKIFAVQDPKTGVPRAGLVATFALSCIGPFLGLGLIDPITEVCAAGFVLSWALTSSSAIRLRITKPDAERPYKMPGGIATAWFAAILMWVFFILFFIPGNPAFLGSLTITMFISWMVIGAVLYLATGPQRNAIPVEERAAALFKRK